MERKKSFVECASAGVTNAYILISSDISEGVKEATAFAKTVNCDKGGCFNCESCLKIDRGEHSDVIILPEDDASESSSIKVNDIRKLHEDAFLKPFEGKYRLFIVSGAERMTPEAQNSTLKILEEPPSGTIIILVVSDIFELLPTIRSRCRVFSCIGSEGVLDVNFQEKFQEIINVSTSSIDAAIDCARRAGGTKDSLLEFLDFLVILLRDSLAVQCGMDTFSKGIETQLSTVKYDDVPRKIDELNYYRFILKERSLNKEMVALNALGVVLDKLSPTVHLLND